MDCSERSCDTEAAVGLPDDPLVEILSRVPAKSLCRFKCVSKAWRDLIADPLHRKKLPQTLQGFFFMLALHKCHCESESESDDEPHGCNSGDGEAKVDEDSDGEELFRYGFIDLSQRSVRLVDFSYVTQLPGIKNTKLIHCCNGLLLFAVKGSWSYVVCNPATEECVVVPSSGLDVSQWDTFYGSTATHLLFDPAGDPCHFSLVEIPTVGPQKSVNVYSSKTQEWSRNQPDSGCYDIAHRSVYFNGMLHAIAFSTDDMTVLDVEGNIQKIIPLPCQAGREEWMAFQYVGWSQGRLHYISEESPDDEEENDGCDDHTEPSFRGFLIWVLEEYERQEWILKDSISFSKLLGERNVNKDIDFKYDVVGIHPDHSLVFLVQLWDQKLISYHIESKEVCDLCTLGHDYWVPDEVAKKCHLCAVDFSPFNRRIIVGTVVKSFVTNAVIDLTAEDNDPLVRRPRLLKGIAKEAANRSTALQSHEDLARKLKEEMEKNHKSSGPASGGNASGTRTREVACATCTVHLQVQVPISGSETVECGVCQHSFLVSAN